MKIPRLQVVKTSLKKKSKFGVFTLADLNNSYKATVIKTVWHGLMDRQMDNETEYRIQKETHTYFYS